MKNIYRMIQRGIEYLYHVSAGHNIRGSRVLLKFNIFITYIYFKQIVYYWYLRVQNVGVPILILVLGPQHSVP